MSCFRKRESGFWVRGMEDGGRVLGCKCRVEDCWVRGVRNGRLMCRSIGVPRVEADGLEGWNGGHCFKGLTGHRGGGLAKNYCVGGDGVQYIEFKATVAQNKNVKVDGRY